jgi:uroporphyrinogen decarboxylase
LAPAPLGKPITGTSGWRAFTAAVIAALGAITHFSNSSGARLPAYARETGVDAVGLDETLDPAWAHASLPEGMPVQGNLDPLLLEAGGAALAARARAIIAAFAERPHVFNLGHGIGQHTPIAHVEALLGVVRG